MLFKIPSEEAVNPIIFQLYFFCLNLSKHLKPNLKKKILYVLLGLAAVYLILCLVGRFQYKVERSIDINAPAEVIKSKIAALKYFHETLPPCGRICN